MNKIIVICLILLMAFRAAAQTGFSKKKDLYFKNHSPFSATQTTLDDSVQLSYKNAITISLIELFAVAVAPRYERFINPKHSVGVHSSFYVYGRNPVSLGSERDYYPNFVGFKLAPGYRYYVLRGKNKGVFLEAKAPFGYFYFNELDYHTHRYTARDVIIQHSFWSLGCSISIGVMLPFPVKKHGLHNISFGYQYFPIYIPETAADVINENTTLHHPHDSYWWYQGGPGSYVEIKYSIGRIF